MIKKEFHAEGWRAGLILLGLSAICAAAVIGFIQFIVTVVP